MKRIAPILSMFANKPAAAGAPIRRFTEAMYKGLKNRLLLKSAFTMIELTLVIIIIGILASVAVPILRGRLDSAKWSEANAAAGTIRTAVSTYVSLKDLDQARMDLVGRSLGDETTRALLGFKAGDLTGTYFAPGDYTITAIDARGLAEITVAGSQNNAPQGTKTLRLTGGFK